MGMSIVPQPCSDPDALLARLGEIEAVIVSRQTIAQAKLGELKRQARARPRRRGGAGSHETSKYAIGGAVLMLTGTIDATTFAGFLAQTDMMLEWMVEARLAHGPLGFGALVAIIFADARKADWCRRWGALIEWHHRKALYDASVTSFITSGRDGPGEQWRRDEVTDDQVDLVKTLCTILDEPHPMLADKGEAYEWIRERGGNPAYWTPPPHPNNWSEDHGHE